MNIEVEVKIKVQSLRELRKKLPEFGKRVKSIRQIDEYYTPRKKDFFARKPHPIEWLRIRTNPNKVVFEYDRSINKKGNGEQECAHEYETEVMQPGELRKILGFLDFRKVITVDKQREYWDCGDVEVCLDEVRGLGSFIEVEAKGEFASNKKAKESCLGYLDKLGVDYAGQTVRMGYPNLLLNTHS